LEIDSTERRASVASRTRAASQARVGTLPGKRQPRRISLYYAHIWLMAAPFLLGLTLLVIAPVLLAAPLAFSSYDVLSPPKAVGLANFEEMGKDELFWNGLRASLILVVVAVPLRVAGTFLLALLLQGRRRFFSLFRGAVYMPTVIPIVAYGMLWLYIFNPLYGPLNGLSQLFSSDPSLVANDVARGNSPGLWLIDPRATHAGIILLLLFTVGEGFVLLLAALREIPHDLYEAAAIDGASYGRQTRHITLPLLAPSLLLLSLRDTVYCLQASFALALVVTKGGPYYATTYLPYYIYLNGSEYLRFGYAAAMSWVLYGTSAVIIALQFWVMRRWKGLDNAV
jgi:multiple sugar transport system permease protein